MIFNIGAKVIHSGLRGWNDDRSSPSVNNFGCTISAPAERSGDGALAEHWNQPSIVQSHSGVVASLCPRTNLRRTKFTALEPRPYFGGSVKMRTPKTLSRSQRRF